MGPAVGRRAGEGIPIRSVSAEWLLAAGWLAGLEVQGVAAANTPSEAGASSPHPIAHVSGFGAHRVCRLTNRAVRMRRCSVAAIIARRPGARSCR
jgi:hypothetical protein